MGLRIDLIDHEVPLGGVALVISQRLRADLLRVDRRRRGPGHTEGGVSEECREAEDAEQGGDDRLPASPASGMSWLASPTALRKTIIVRDRA
jgi:hypothetical protein